MIELGLRLMLASAKADAHGPEAFVRQAKKFHKVPSTYHDLDDAYRYAGQFYVVLNVAVLDSFCQDLQSEYRDLKQIPKVKWVTSLERNTLSVFDRFAANLRHAEAKTLKESVEHHLLGYYRECRHEFLHGDKGAAHALWLTLPIQEIRARYSRVPSAPEALSHTDHVLFRKALLRYADLLGDLCLLTPEDVAGWCVRNDLLLAEIRKHKSPPSRLLRKLARAIGWQFGATAQEMHRVADLVALEPAVQETRQEKRRRRKMVKEAMRRS